MAKKKEDKKDLDDALTPPEPPVGYDEKEEPLLADEASDVIEEVEEPVEDAPLEEEPKTEKSKDEVITEYEQDNDKLHKKGRKLKTYFFFFGVITLSIIAFFIQNKTVWNIEKGPLIGTLSFSILFNIIVILILFATGMGQEIIGRLKRKLMFRTGLYVNTLYVSKNGPIKEKFVKVDKETGRFKLLGKTYTRNPSLLHHYKGIPTYWHREGNPDPVNVFQRELASQMSNDEIDNVMNNMNAFDFKEWMENNIKYIFIGLFILVAATVVSAYLGFNTFQMLRDGTFEAAKVVVTNATTIVPTVI